MKIIVRAEIVTDWGETFVTEIAQIERPMQEIAPETIGLSLEDGKRLLHTLQTAVVRAQVYEIGSLSRMCRRCQRTTEIKDYRQRKIDTVFGTVSFRSPRIITCECEPPFFISAPLSPLATIIPERATPELIALQAKLAAQMSYRRVVETMKEFLPVSSTFNHVTVRNRTLRAGAQIEKVHPQVQVVPLANAEKEWTLAIDGGFVRGGDKGGKRNFEILTGRLGAPQEKPYVFAWVRAAVPSASERVMDLVKAHSGMAEPRLTVITDGANGIQNIHRMISPTVKPVLDWFHISMRVRYLEQIKNGLAAKSEAERYTKKLIGVYLDKLRWCFWNANAKKAEERMRQILMLCRIVVPETKKFKRALRHLDYRLRELFSYLDNNKGALIAYGKDQRAGKPISTAMAESAVNQVINARMCKSQQMHWTPRGAHFLAQVRCAVLNGDLTKKLKAYLDAQEAQIPDHIERFLEQLQRAAT